MLTKIHFHCMRTHATSCARTPLHPTPLALLIGEDARHYWEEPTSMTHHLLLTGQVPPALDVLIGLARGHLRSPHPLRAQLRLPGSENPTITHTYAPSAENYEGSPVQAAQDQVPAQSSCQFAREPAPPLRLHRFVLFVQTPNPDPPTTSRPVFSRA